LRKLFVKLFNLFVFSSLFIALCAVAMVYQTYYLFHIPYYPDFIWFAFFGTLCSYNFHWYLTPALYGGSYRAQWSVNHKNLHLALYLIGLGGCGWFGVQLFEHWIWLIVTALITFLYSAPKIPYPPFTHLKKIAVGKTIFLALVWAHTTSLLPLLLQNMPLEPVHVIYFINRFFFIYAICILFDYRDREDDKRQGIKSMITHFNERGINRLFYISILIFLITTILLYITGVSLANCIFFLIPGFVLGLLYDYSKKISSDYYYYFFLDGLMALSAVLIFSFSYICPNN
jgi:4-hydroxybenzoate polyprenyltransferase